MEKQQRLDEIKAKAKELGGFVKLPYADKQEYKTIKDSLGITTPDESSELKDEETIAVPKATFNELIERINRLESEKGKSKAAAIGSHWEEIDTKPVIRTATLRVMGDKYLVDYKHDRYNWNEKLREMQDIYKVYFLLPNNEKEEAEMSLSSIAKLSRKEVTILDVQVQKLRRVLGKTDQHIYDFDGFGSGNKLGGKVDVEVHAVNRTFTVELEDKRKITLDEGRLNN